MPPALEGRVSTTGLQWKFPLHNFKMALVSPKWRGPSPLALSCFGAEASACTTCCIRSSPQAAACLWGGPTGHLYCRHNTRPRSTTFAFRGGGSSLGDSPSLTLAVQEAPSPPACIPKSCCCCGFLRSPKWVPPELSLCCSQMGTWGHHPFLMIGAPHPPPGNQWRPHGESGPSLLPRDNEVPFCLLAG